MKLPIKRVERFHSLRQVISHVHVVLTVTDFRLQLVPPLVKYVKAQPKSRVTKRKQPANQVFFIQAASGVFQLGSWPQSLSAPFRVDKLLKSNIQTFNKIVVQISSIIYKLING